MPEPTCPKCGDRLIGYRLLGARVLICAPCWVAHRKGRS